MAYENPLNKISLPANADLSSDQYKFATVNSSAKAIKNATAGARVLGVLQNKPSAADQAAEIATGGLVKVLCGTGGLDEGNLVMSDVNGAAVVATSTNYVVGMCVAAAASTEYATIMLLHMGIL